MSGIDYQKCTDEELMVLYQQSNQLAFDELFARWKNRVWGFVAKRVQPVDLREDIVQKIFLKLHRKRHLYNKSYLFAQWVFTISKTVTIDELRILKKHQVSTLNSNDEQEVLSPEIETNLSSLSKDQQEILKMKFEQDFEYKEIAKLLNKSEVSVRKIFSRAIEKLRIIKSSGGL